MNNLFLVNETFTNGYLANILNIISLFAIFCGVFVIISKNPVVSVLFLIGLFGNIASYLILIGLGFMGLAYLVVYIGAIKKRNLNNVALVQIQLYKVLLIIIKIFQKEFIEGLLFFGYASLVNTGIIKIISKMRGASLSRAKLYNTLTNHTVNTSNSKRFYSTKSSLLQSLSDENFFKWFVGFSDGESNFTIVFYKDKNGNVLSATFRFTIELHIDDVEVLNYIKSRLNIGTNIAVYGNSCKFTVVHRKDINVLISIFDKFNLNTTKHLDYLDFKKAFILYNESKEVDKTIIIDELLKLKNGMNSNRYNFNLSCDHKIVISDYWLLGLIEGEGSFHLGRTDLRASFTIGLSQVQLPVLEKIQNFLESNLLFDKYSMFKLKNSSCITVGTSIAGSGNSKPFARLVIRNASVLTNYFIPFFNNMTFISKKGKDFEDFKIICTALYNGTYRNELIRSLILKLSYTMNNYRLSTNTDSKKVSNFSKDDRENLVNAKPTIIHLSDGRQVDSVTRKEIISRWTNCVYEIINDKGEETLVSSINEAATILNVDFRTLKRNLESEALYSKGGFFEIKGKKVRRVPVFCPNK